MAAGAVERKARLKRSAFVVGFLAPATLVYSIFVLWPLLQTFQLGFYRWKGLSKKRTYIGLENFQSLASDENYRGALTNNLALLVFGGLTLVFLGVGIAHALADKSRIAKVTRALYLFPHVASAVVAAIIWSFLVNPSFGLIAKGGKSLGLPIPSDGILATAPWAKATVFAAFVWHALGFFVMLFSAGIESLDREIIEASELDGSSGMNRFWKITWPMLWPLKRVAAVYAVSNVMNLFVIVFVLTQGGPDGATESLLRYLWQKNYDGVFGYVAAMGAVNLVIALLLAGVALLAVGPNPERGRKTGSALTGGAA